MDVAKILLNTSEKFADKPAIIFKDRPIDFRQLRDDSFKLADSLKKLGVRKSDKVAIYLPNWPEYVVSYLAIFSLGATVVPLDYLLTIEELVSCLSHSEAKFLIALSKEKMSFQEIKDRVNSLEDIILCKEKKEGYLSLEDLIAAGSPIYPNTEIKNDDYSIIMYTSGSTGRPKGVLKTYRNLDATPMAMKHTVDLTEKDCMLCALPLSHDGGFIYILNCLYFGCTVVMMDRFIPLEFLKNVQKYKVSIFWLVPSMFYAMLLLKEFEKFDLGSLTKVVVFGAPSSPALLKRFHRYCSNAKFLNGWGMTETMGPTIVLPMDSDNIASVGKPIPEVEIKIVDNYDKEIPIGSVGELVLRSWIVMAGYYKDPQITSEVMYGGWLHTGDLARIDAEGFVYIVGRKKEMIKVGGQLVYSPEIEEAIHKHPKVKEVAVIGVPDKLRGEVPKAFIVLKEAEKATEDDVRYFAKEHLAHFKVPHYYEFRDSLPKTRTGKIDKEILRINSQEAIKK
jgi:long-chain acyl-CoA synthetase